MPSLFPERLSFWESIEKTEEMQTFLVGAINKYLALYEANAKGKSRYTNLYLAWLQYIRTFTCETERTSESTAKWSRVLSKHDGELPTDNIQRTVISCILHAVQAGVQQEMAEKIEKIDCVESVPQEYEEKLSDDTALLRISGWALKSVIQLKKNAIHAAKKNSAEDELELQLLTALKRSPESKSSLPAGARYLDRGGLTFVHSSLLPWAQALEASIKQHMNQAGYKKYGKQIFKVFILYLPIKNVIDYCVLYADYQGNGCVRCYIIY